MGWLLLTLLTMVTAAQLAQLQLVGAKVLPSGLVVAYGSALLGGRKLPALLVASVNGSVLYSALLDVGLGGAFLDVIAADDGYYAVGYVRGVVGRQAILLAKLGRSGVEWAKALGGGASDYAKAIVKLGDDYLVACVTRSYSLLRGSDLLILRVSGEGEVEEAWALGVPAYEDFVEKAYVVGSDVLLVGTTWSYNVSFSDAMLVWLRNGSAEAVVVGGVDVDEGYIALPSRDRVVLAGSTRSSGMGQSDAYIAMVGQTLYSVRAIGWPSYDGFTAACPLNNSYILLGYATLDTRQDALLVLADDTGFPAAYVISCGGDATPLAVGHCENGVLAALSCSNSLVLVLFSPDLKPLSAVALANASTAPTSLKVLRVSSLSRRCETLTSSWTLKRHKLSVRSVTPLVKPLEARLVPLNLSSVEVEVTTGDLREGKPLPELLMEVLEEYLPLLALIAPVVILVALILILKRR